MSNETTEKARVASAPVSSREWAPHFWEGCDFFAWIRLLVRNRFAVGWRHLYIALIVTFVSMVHTLLRWLQQAIYGRALRRTPLHEPPLFIIGHWRTGTTLLHELLILDERFSFPNTYQCLEPNHFLLTEGLVKRFLWFLMPSRRPMDNMPAGWDRPQEDEFALCMMGQPSPYLTIAFPNHPPQDQEAFTVRELAPAAQQRWKKAFSAYLQRLAFKDPRRLVLKSPTHSFRLPVLLELFPQAQFIHIVRDPYAVFPSTVNLWKSLYETQGLQTPTYAGLEEYVYNTYTRLYQELEAGKPSVPANHFYELKYEDLIRNPLEVMRALYEHLQLGEFEKVAPRLQKFFEENKGYQTNRYPRLSPEQIQTITERWGGVIQRYGYSAPTPSKEPSR